MRVNKILSLIFSIITFHNNLLLSQIDLFFIFICGTYIAPYLVSLFLLFNNFRDCKGRCNLQKIFQNLLIAHEE